MELRQAGSLFMARHAEKAAMKAPARHASCRGVSTASTQLTSWWQKP